MTRNDRWREMMRYMTDGADVEIADGWAGRGDEGFAIIGYEALTERGEAFLTAFCAETCEAMGYPPFDPDKFTIESGSMFPKELPLFRRMAAAAGVRLADHTEKETTS
jgi:hypothetical protein